MTTCFNLIRKDLKNFRPYRSARKEAGYVDIMLNANERAWPNALYPKLYRYPDQQPKKAVTLLSKFYNVQPNQLLMSRGSDEAIELLIRLFCQPRKEAILICPPTFDMYEVSATLQAIQTVKVPLNNNFNLNISAILSAWNPAIKILFLCSPNNPTGNLIPTTEIQLLCKSLTEKCIVVVDEAYIEFAKQESLSRFINDFDNLVILRTLSKALGLAGARCGIALSNNMIIQKLLSIMAPYPIPTMLVEVIENIMRKDRLIELHQSIEWTQFLRAELIQQLKTFSFIKKVIPTEANFILIQVANPRYFLNYCISNNILLRDMSTKPGLSNTIRISIGSQSDINQLLDCMRQYNE